MKVPLRTCSLLDRLLAPLGALARSTIFLSSLAAVILVAVFWDYLSQAHSFLTLPGLLVDSLCANKFSGGFGDWRDPILIVAGAWSFWISPLFVIWAVFRFRLRTNENH